MIGGAACPRKRRKVDAKRPPLHMLEDFLSISSLCSFAGMSISLPPF
jgi:hypothetical protein